MADKICSCGWPIIGFEHGGECYDERHRCVCTGQCKRHGTRCNSKATRALVTRDDVSNDGDHWVCERCVSGLVANSNYRLV